MTCDCKLAIPDGTAVTAVPDTGYHFVEWSDSVATATRTDTNVTADISVTASFAINEYTLTYTAGANGTISGTITYDIFRTLVMGQCKNVLHLVDGYGENLTQIGGLTNEQ